MITVDGATETLYYYHYDGLGSVAALSNISGTIVEAYSYDAFGKPRISTGAGIDGLWRTSDDATDTLSAIGNPYLFTARQYDDETGLYYYRARMYHPQLGRFMQTDPIGYGDGGLGGLINGLLGGGLGGALSGALSGALMGGLVGGPAGIVPGAIAGAIQGAIVGALSGALGSAINTAMGGPGFSSGQGFQAGLAGGAIAGSLAGGYAGLTVNAAMAPAAGSAVTSGAGRATGFGNGGSTVTLYHGGNLSGGINPTSLSTTTNLAHAQQYAQNAGGVIYEFAVPTELLRGYQVQTYMDSYMGGVPAVEYRFYGQSAANFMNYFK